MRQDLPLKWLEVLPQSGRPSFFSQAAGSERNRRLLAPASRDGSAHVRKFDLNRIGYAFSFLSGGSQKCFVTPNRSNSECDHRMQVLG